MKYWFSVLRTATISTALPDILYDGDSGTGATTSVEVALLSDVEYEYERYSAFSVTADSEVCSVSTAPLVGNSTKS